jgi:two-component sensor histidine kinase
VTPPPQHAYARLLYIDDDGGLCRLVKRGLERQGYRVDTATSGPDGVRMAAETRFDVIAVDHYMPGQDGLVTLSQLCALPRAPPIIYVTGSDESRIAVAALKAGAVDYVVKSIAKDFNELLSSALDQALSQIRLLRERDAAQQALSEANARLEAIVAHQAVMLQEVNHRVANSLQLIASLVHMQAAAVSDEAAQSALRDTQARIAAIMQVHRRLYTSEDVQVVDMKEYLSGLVAELQQSLTPGGAQRHIRLVADPVKLNTDKAVSLGVIVAELVTNACKYAYAEDEDGDVRVAFHRDSTNLRLVVEDDGRGMPQTMAPKGTGLGQRVIAAMAKSLNAAVQFDANHDGARAVLAFEG